MAVAAVSRRLLLVGATAACAPLPAPMAGPMDVPTGLETAVNAAMDDNSSAVLISRDGDILSERYAAGWSAERPREVFSVAKSLLAVLFAMAVEDGAVTGLDQAAADFVPVWRDDGRRAITLRHMMSMTSGLDDTGLALRGVTGDQFALNAAAALRDPPGTRWAYNTAAYHLLFHILARATGERFETYAARKLLDPLGMAHTRWVTSPGQGEAGPVINYYSAESTARDLAKIGALVLDQGRQGGRQLIMTEHLRALLTPSQTLNPSYGLLWWLNSQPGFDATGTVHGRRFPRAPRDTVAALGALGQALVIVPSRRLIVVRQGDRPEARDLPDSLVFSTLAT